MNIKLLNVFYLLVLDKICPTIKLSSQNFVKKLGHSTNQMQLHPIGHSPQHRLIILWATATSSPTAPTIAPQQQHQQQPEKTHLTHQNL